MRVLLFLVTIVMRSSSDNLYILQLDCRARRLRVYEGGQSDYGGDGEGYCGEEAEDVLEAHKRGVHRECSPFRGFGGEKGASGGLRDCGLSSGELRDTVAGLEVGAWTCYIQPYGGCAKNVA
jgi:hypothetical protein